MSRRSNDHLCHVPVAGFRWVKAASQPERQKIWLRASLVRCGPFDSSWYLVAKEGEQRSYNPSESPDLFRLFAGTKPDRDHVLEFATQYGLLGRAAEIPAGRRARPAVRQLVGESLETWTSNICIMKELIHVWDLCEQDSTEELANFIQWSDDGFQVSYISQAARDTALRRPTLTGMFNSDAPLLRAASPATAVTFDCFTPNDVLLPALFFIQAEVNRHVESAARIRLVWHSDGTLRVQYRPTSLLGVLWLQFAEAISDRMVYRACPTCLRWVRVTPGAKGPSRVYCSNACRTKALRWRQNEARRRHAAGESLTSIAAALGSNENAVTAWVTGTKQG